MSPISLLRQMIIVCFVFAHTEAENSLRGKAQTLPLKAHETATSRYYQRKVRQNHHLQQTNNGGVTSVLNPSTNTPVNDENSSSISSFLNGSASRIVGGTTVQPSKASFFTLLLTYDAFRGVWKSLGCGGSLISDRHILTAAHCVQGRSGLNDAVFVNAYAPFNGNVRNNTKYPYHFSRVKAYIIHPSFNDASNANDVAIITLQRPIIEKLNQFPTIRLLSTNQTIPFGQMSTIYGFERKAATAAAAVNAPTNFADTLQEINLTYRSYSECKPFYTWKLLPDMICAGDAPYTLQDACTGDSGGPMTTEINGVVYQIGVVSWGTTEGCGQSSKPGVYASIQYHYSWIKKLVCETDGVDKSMGLCQTTSSFGEVGNIFDKNLPVVVPHKIESSSCTRGKPNGLPCSYGGECCSGICSRQSQYYDTRICLDKSL